MNVLLVSAGEAFLPVFFYYLCESKGIESRINQPDPLLEEHVSKILAGKVTTGKLGNPKALTFRLVAHFDSSGGIEPDLNQAIAFIYSLANDYLARVRESQSYLKRAFS